MADVLHKKAAKSAHKGQQKPHTNSKPKEKVLFEIEHYPQTEEFTSSAACAMMVLKHLNPEFKMKKDEEYSIWQEAVNGSVWHGSKYGLAYSLGKRGARVKILSNTKDEGYDKKLAVYENVNLDTLAASYNEIKKKAEDMHITEEYTSNVSVNNVKKALSSNQIPIVLIDANAINPYLESSPHWIVVKGYDKDAFYINDPYSDSTITLDHDAFKQALGYDSNFHMILADARHKSAASSKKKK
jgi:hypothetical protein